MSLILLAAAALAAPANPARAAPIQFPIGDRVLTGRGPGNCLIEGRWGNGARLRYRAWDVCAKLSVRLVPRASIGAATPLGSDRTTRVSDIPARAEILQIDNATSSVLLFRDKAGRQREILIGD